MDIFYTGDWQRYHFWMINEVVPNANLAKIYTNMFEIIDMTPYIPHITDDMNRVKDAIYMRQNWFRENNCILEIPDNKICCGYCSVFELLVSFAKRIDKEWLGHGGEDHPELIFSVFMDNLYLTHYTNDILRNPIESENMQSRIARFVSNDVSDYGVGGLFPLYDRCESQKGKSLWHQMMPWLKENSDNW